MVSGRISVVIRAVDPILQNGVASHFRDQPQIQIVDTVSPEQAEVAVAVVDRMTEDALQIIRSLRRQGCKNVVVIATQVDSKDLLMATEAGCCGLLRRSEASPERLVAAVRAAAAGDGTLPPDLLGSLFAQVGRLQRQLLTPLGVNGNGLTRRELQVLRLLAEGHATSEIADRLAYSERTVKNIIHDVTTRYQLRNRTHAVAYAIREGLI